MIRIVSYGVVSAAGPSVKEFWSSLVRGAVPERLPQNGGFPLLENLMQAWREARKNLPESFNWNEEVGVILASTKGLTEDWVWDKKFSDWKSDPITPLLSDFIRRAELSPKHWVSVSNACASSHAALWLGQKWLAQERVKTVIVLACDQIGPFVLKGFQTLKVLASDKARPFSIDRDGLELGSAAAAIVLSSDPSAVGPELAGVALINDGSALTRPSESGAALRKACETVQLGFGPPDLIVAHGTGTPLNDQTEDEVFHELFKSSNPDSPIVTGTKWCTGHTMGASGAIDLIAACEILKNQKIFPIATTQDADPNLKCAHAVAGKRFPDREISTVLISSLGFGGTHAAARVVRGDI